MVHFDPLARLWNLYTRQWVTPGRNNGPDAGTDPHTYRAVRRLVSSGASFPTDEAGWVALNATFRAPFNKSCTYCNQAVVMAPDETDWENFPYQHPERPQPPCDYYGATVSAPTDDPLCALALYRGALFYSPG